MRFAQAHRLDDTTLRKPQGNNRRETVSESFSTILARITFS